MPPKNSFWTTRAATPSLLHHGARLAAHRAEPGRGVGACGRGTGVRRRGGLPVAFRGGLPVPTWGRLGKFGEPTTSEVASQPLAVISKTSCTLVHSMAGLKR